jgi:hypothetical protein
MGVTTGLIQGQTGVFTEQMQGQYLYVLGYLASVFGNSVSMLIAMLSLLSYSNRYRATIAITHNIKYLKSCLLGLDIMIYSMLQG